LVWLLLLLSVTSIAIFFERLFFFHRARIDVGDFLEGIGSSIRHHNYAETLHEVSVNPSPVARVVKAALRRHKVSRDELRSVVEEAGQLEVPRLERRLSTLFTISTIAPLVGLMGTLLGLMHCFGVISELEGAATARDVSHGVYESLVSSAVGLAVAIPAYLLFGFLYSKSKNLRHDLERAGIEIVNLICDNRGPRSQNDIVEFPGQQQGVGGAEEAGVSGVGQGS